MPLKEYNIRHCKCKEGLVEIRPGDEQLCAAILHARHV